jgi:hypothetical protein
VYCVEADEQAQHQMDALPPAALALDAELRAVVEPCRGTAIR